MMQATVAQIPVSIIWRNTKNLSNFDTTKLSGDLQQAYTQSVQTLKIISFQKYFLRYSI